jgi:hypothetical protein
MQTGCMVSVVVYLCMTPAQESIADEVMLGDVGYVFYGRFNKFFNLFATPQNVNNMLNKLQPIPTFQSRKTRESAAVLCSNNVDKKIVDETSQETARHSIHIVQLYN